MAILAGSTASVYWSMCAEPLNPACLAFLGGLDYRLVVPTGVEAAGAIQIDLSDDASLTKSIAALDGWPCDVVLALRDLQGLAPESVTEGGDALVELSFAACRHFYARLADHTVAFAGVSLMPGPQSDPACIPRPDCSADSPVRWPRSFRGASSKCFTLTAQILRN